ncbi:hypothetical protein [Sinomonas sp. P47F7]|uniref:hypothetical protein n=1 Tax=Sinomonas sp. P47F7 TaxID=3410987 RepID=UPI003BF58D56
MTSGSQRASAFGRLSGAEIFGQDLSALGFLGVLRAPASRRWFIGSGIAVVFWIIGGWDRFAAAAIAAGALPLRTAHLVLFMLSFMLIPPFSWGRPLARKLALLAFLVVLSLGFFLYDSSGGGWYCGPCAWAPSPDAPRAARGSARAGRARRRRGAESGREGSARYPRPLAHGDRRQGRADGPASAAEPGQAPDGHGLSGLGEGARAAGLTLSLGRSELGGYRLRVAA